MLKVGRSRGAFSVVATLEGLVPVVDVVRDEAPLGAEVFDMFDMFTDGFAGAGRG